MLAKYRRALAPACLLLLCLGPVEARRAAPSCGTYPGRWQEDLDRYRKASARRSLGGIKTRALTARRDANVGHIAVLEADASILAPPNTFDLAGFKVTFTPAASGYRYETTANTLAALPNSTPITDIGDDDSRRLDLPFTFAYFGGQYREVWLNSDGNLTFTAPDNATSDRSVGRFTFGPPRIAGLFSDLDPSMGIGALRVASSANSFTVRWEGVPEYHDFGVGNRQTFQIQLFADGKIELAWSSVNIVDAVVGISPGDFRGRSLLTGFRDSPSGSYEGVIAERFTATQEIDLVAASRRFYETHDDAYDYLAFFNGAGIQAGTNVIAFQTSVRTSRQGIGDIPVDLSSQYGSPNRLQAVLNMGPVSNYPADPNALMPQRFGTGDTGMTIFAHEVGHLFLAFASVRDPRDPDARPMLGRQNFHWNFKFNSEASLLEGNRIQDNGENANPRFSTVATVQGYSPLDQYLMGLRPPAEVPVTFLVENASIGNGFIDPRVGVSFNGTRRNVTAADLIAVEGRRTPDHTVEQRRYRMAVILIVPEGQSASSANLEVVERYRSLFPAAFSGYTGGLASMDTTLRKAVRISAEPAAGAVVGRPFAISVAIQQPAEASLTIPLQTANGLSEGPASVTIPAGERSAQVAFRAIGAGVELIRALPGSEEWMSTEARIGIAPGISVLKLQVESGEGQPATPGLVLPRPIILRLTDENLLPYAGFRIVASEGGVSPESAVTGPDGRVSFQWTAPADGRNLIRFTVEGSPVPVAEVSALGVPIASPDAVVNAASFRGGVAPGSIATIFGFSLGNAQVSVEGIPATIFFASPTQVNFLVPALTTAAATASIVVTTPAGSIGPLPVPLAPIQPGIFFDPASGRAAAIPRGNRIFELYATGLGPIQAGTTVSPVTARVGDRDANILFSGLAPGFPGLYQVNIQVHPAVAPGEQPISITASGLTSNEARLLVEP